MSGHKDYGSLQTETILQSQWNMAFANDLSHEDIIEASVAEMFESHRNHPLDEEPMQLEQGNLQEWGNFIVTSPEL